jgi:chromosome segregation and condensation protein ScpB
MDIDSDIKAYNGTMWLLYQIRKDLSKLRSNNEKKKLELENREKGLKFAVKLHNQMFSRKISKEDKNLTEEQKQKMLLIKKNN